MSDEWISITDAFPKLNQKVEVRFNTGIPYYCKFCILSGELMFSSSVDNQKYLWSYIHSWRPIPEKRPDFSKLKEGDLLLAETLNGVFAGFYYCIDGEGICLLGKEDARFSYAYSVQEIKKITRINLEKQTFEEI